MHFWIRCCNFNGLLISVRNRDARFECSHGAATTLRKVVTLVFVRFKSISLQLFQMIKSRWNFEVYSSGILLLRVERKCMRSHTVKFLMIVNIFVVFLFSMYPRTGLTMIEKRQSQIVSVDTLSNSKCYTHRLAVWKSLCTQMYLEMTD